VINFLFYTTGLDQGTCYNIFDIAENIQMQTVPIRFVFMKLLREKR